MRRAGDAVIDNDAAPQGLEWLSGSVAAANRFDSVGDGRAEAHFAEGREDEAERPPRYVHANAPSYRRQGRAEVARPSTCVLIGGVSRQLHLSFIVSHAAQSHPPPLQPPPPPSPFDIFRCPDHNQTGVM